MHLKRFAGDCCWPPRLPGAVRRAGELDARCERGSGTGADARAGGRSGRPGACLRAQGSRGQPAGHAGRPARRQGIRDAREGRRGACGHRSQGLPLLEEATRNPDAEIAQRASDAIARIKGAEEEAGVPDIPRHHREIQAEPGPELAHARNDHLLGKPQGPGRRYGEHGGRRRGQTDHRAKGAEARTFTAPSLGEFEIRYPKLYAKYLDTSTAAAKAGAATAPGREAPPAPAKAPEAKAVDPSWSPS